ncbi:hypothetical protein HN371_24380 [Candidatus Poribacteria bacterium]|jgi:Tol biopolymer transport system component|nr:hypothetical protein [Candidatus Poribacteria bacterium]MBT5710922.1 hypothetical protein [Candidatus Poribacteria bacterium]MBT7096011.1 hypothetical protein [Candidatus Poribacteria bacterium]
MLRLAANLTCLLGLILLGSVQAIAAARMQIAYTADWDGDWQIYIVDASGGEPRRLITDGHRNGRPVFSPDGRYVYFDSDRDAPRDAWAEAEIYRLEVRSGAVRRLTFDGGRCVGPQMNRDGRRLLYWRHGGVAFWTVHMLDLKTGRSAQLAEGVKPSWHADGARVLFVPSPRSRRLHILDPRTNSVDLITASRFAAGTASSDPAGDRIVLDATRNGGSATHVVDMAAGSAEPLIPWDEARSATPDWSPNGDRIAVAIQAAGSVDLFTTDVRGRARVRVTTHPTREMWPSWHDPARAVGESALGPAVWGWLRTVGRQ